MSLTKIGSIGINTGIQFAGVTTVSTLHVGSGVTLSSDGDIFATGISTFSEDIKVGSGVTISPDGDGFYTGVVTATSYYGDGSNLSNITSTTINNNADNRLITGSGTANTLEAESSLTFDGTNLDLGADNKKLRLGGGPDIELYTDGSNSFLNNENGNWYIHGSTGSNSQEILIRPKQGENSIRAIADGAVELYHNNTKMAYTSADGFDVTNGDLRAHIDVKVLSDDRKLFLGAGNDLRLYHNGTNSYIDNITGDFYIRGVDEKYLYIQAKSGENSIICKDDGAVELYYDNVKKLNTNSNGISIQGGAYFNSSAVTGTPLTYLYGYAGTDAKGVTIENIEAGLELISNAGGNHSSSILLRNLNDGFAIINDNDANSLQIRYFTAVSNDFNAHGNGNGLSKLETSAVFNEDGAVQLYNNNALKFDTVSTGIRVHGSEGGDAQVQLLADEGDDNADYWRILAGAAGQLDVANYATGSWVNHMTIKGNGNVTHPNQACMVFGNAIDVSNPSNSTPLQFSGLEVSKGGMSESNSRSRITVPTTGTYLIYGMLSGSISSAASTDGVEITLLKNGSVYPNVYNHPISSYGVNNGDEYAFQLTQILNVSANDYLEVCFTNINSAVAGVERGHFAVTLLH